MAVYLELARLRGLEDSHHVSSFQWCENSLKVLFITRKSTCLSQRDIKKE